MITAKTGDTVFRYFGTELISSMRLIVTDVTDFDIICGDYTFSKETGYEIDDFLGWNGAYSGSYIKNN